jgi:hypothetical protein
MTNPIADASGSSPISANDDVLLALARVESSLRIVLAAIAELQREIGITPKLTQDPSTRSGQAVPLKPDSSWIGTP